MSDPDRVKYLRISLLLVGLLCMVGFYPLTILWSSGWTWNAGQSEYLQMILGIYATLGVFLVIASRNPLAHRSLIWFTVWSSIVHGGIMAAQSVANTRYMGHLWGDVLALFVVAAVLGLLMPRGAAPKSRPYLPIALIAILAAAAVIGFFVFGNQPARQAASTVPLGLTVELRDPGLLVKWNPRSPDVLQGTSGMLSIQAGTQQLQLPLDRQALREGNVFYVPVSPRAQFHLEIYRDANHYTGETISAATGLHAAVLVAQPAPEPTSAPFPAAQKVSIEQPRHPPSPSNPRPITTRSRVVARFEPPRSIAGQPQATLSASDPALPTPPQIAASIQVRLPDLPALHPEYSAITSVPSGSYVAAVPVRQINPTIPPGLHLMTTEGLSITVRVEIDSGGRVVSADPVDARTPAQRLVAPAAAEAARSWRFEPARRNEQPVPSEALLKFDIERLP